MEAARRLAANPADLMTHIGAVRGSRHVVIDEVMAVPALLQVIPTVLKAQRGLRFVLIGSNMRGMRSDVLTALGPSVSFLSLHGMMAAELGDRFELGQALKTGMLPIIQFGPQPELAIRAYNATVLHEEIQHQGLTRNPGAIARFLETLTRSHAGVLNLSQMAREAAVPRKTAEGYLKVLEDLQLIFQLPVFAHETKRALATHATVYFADAGLFRANLPAAAIDAAIDVEGVALKGLVAQHLLSWCAYSPGNHHLHHWSTRSRVAVDFVVHGSSKFHAINVRNSSQVRPQDLRSLRAFGEDHPSATRWLLYRGSQPQVLDGVRCEPVERFLKALVPGSFPPAAQNAMLQ